MAGIALYVHIPFCVRKCAYCDFASYAGREGLIDAYLNELSREAEAARETYGPMAANTLYVGGGTPSILNEAQIGRLLGILNGAFDLSGCAEATFECNPGTLTRDKLRALKDSGINRLSLGVQAFDDRLLRVLGRIHTAREAVQAVTDAHAAGFDNLSVDLMHAVPDQTCGDLRRSLETAVSLPVRHISCYSLIVEDMTPMAALYLSEPERFPGEDQAVQMQRLTSDVLEGAGFQRYEISNYARPGYESRHNLTYWRRGEYLGLGVAAHSMMRGERFGNTASLDDYLRGARAVTRETLTERDVYEETVMLGLRTREGVEAALLPPDKLDKLARQGLMAVESGKARVTARGADVLNAVILALM